MASWKMAPALAAGNCVVLKPARLTPLSVLLLMEVIGDLCYRGRRQRRRERRGRRIGEYLATSKRIAKGGVYRFERRWVSRSYSTPRRIILFR